MTFPYLFDVKMLIVANIFKIFIIIQFEYLESLMVPV